METNSLRRKLTAWSLILAICVLMIFPAALAESYEAEVTASTMVVRSGPSTSYEVVARLSKGTKVTVQSVSDGIAYISFSGKTGYALASDMKKVQSGSSSVSGLLPFLTVPARAGGPGWRRCCCQPFYRGSRGRLNCPAQRNKRSSP